ncbi:MAG: A24 family peptidase C-terminal domain-containing protein [Halodesulfurarchaeum sp.]|nr:A24 family peptidase C-terminal domain-containing protein [Halodesulfurarchaeum sp.]
MDATIPDLLRLLAVPVLGWAAVRDARTRRVPNRTWYPLVSLGVLLLLWDALVLGFEGPGFSLFLLRAGLGIAIVGTLAMGFWFTGSFGGADAKAFLAIAVLFPTYPAYELFGTTLPVVVTDLGIFSLTILTNAVLVGVAYPIALAVGNARSGERSPLSFVARRVSVSSLLERHGTLLDTDGSFTQSGLDLDALRMYLRWRRVDLDTVCANPALVDPNTLPEDPGDPTDGAVETGGVADTSAGSRAEAADWNDGPIEDRWGAAAFLAAIDTTAYGTDPEDLRTGLDRIVDAESVWVSPGIPFIVPTFLGLVLALTVGDLLFLVLGLFGVVA